MIEGLLSGKEWLITEESYEPLKNLFYETLFTLANGYVGVRGSLEQGSQNNLRTTYFAGVYDATIGFFTELANSPSWIGIKIIAEGEIIDFEKGELLTYRRVLDMKKGILTQLLRWKSKTGKITRFESYRLVHMCYRHTSLIKGIIVPENYSGTISIKGGLDGYIFNRAQGNQLKIKHFQLTEYEDRDQNGVYLEMKTYNSEITVGVASKLMVNVPSHRDVGYDVDKITEVITFHAESGRKYDFEKIVTFFTSRDIDPVKKAVLKELLVRHEKNVDHLLQDHISAWNEKWNTADIKIVGDDRAQKSLRFNIFHLIQSANSNDGQASVGAKALHGDGYRGHVFWDTEIFMVPFYIYTDPKTACTLLMYRYHNLDAARKNARINGYQGAQFPWESADTGDEITPKEMGDLIRGYKTRVWTGDEEHHIVADVAYEIDHYYVVTGDDSFLIQYGAEILLETARFWVSRVEFDPQRRMYVINKVIGPDEYHEHVNNSVFTNFMARWNINKAFEYIEKMKTFYPDDWNHLKNKISLENEELRTWKDVVQRLYIPYDEQTGLYEEFEGYFNLEDPILRENNLHSVPIELERKASETTLVKQADVILLQYLLNSHFTQKSKKLNFEYYEPRTTHSSSLSPSIHAILSNEIGDYSKSYKYFMKAARIDLDDSKKNTIEGIHAASLGGTWQAAINGFAGMRILDGKLAFNPHLPEKWKKMDFKIKWRGETLNISVTKELIEVSLQTNSKERFIDIVIGQKTMSIKGGQIYMIHDFNSS
ncbi:MAG: Kojibiose phosphorylase [Candidatus Heimdallarchaeota archaeon LC_3]|nr:MAG: Kojibiose phosphorylase [Candidatus Heimdallarchaeota archaeon LC_3]